MLTHLSDNIEHLYPLRNREKVHVFRVHLDSVLGVYFLAQLRLQRMDVAVINITSNKICINNIVIIF